MLVGITMVKDEEDILPKVLLHLLGEGVDHLIVADNLSTDETPFQLEAIRNDYPERLTVLQDEEVAYYQSRKMTVLAERAGEMGADWIVPFDADEFWCSRYGSLSEVFANVEPHVGVLAARMWEQFGDKRSRCAKTLPKVAFRYTPGCVVAQGNHSVGGVPGAVAWDLIDVREFQYRSLEQMKRKVRNGKAAYDATDLPLSEGAHWRQYGAMSDGDIEAVWAGILLREDLIYDPIPGLTGGV